MSYESFRDRHKGEKIVVCGCGKSATLAPVGSCRIIGVNDIGRLFTPDYLVVVNDKHSFRGDRWQWIEGSSAKYCFTQFPKLATAAEKVLLKLGKYGQTDFRSEQVGYTNNSPYIGCLIAAFMGAREIGLLGVDFTPNHFFADTGVHPLTTRLPNIVKEYEALAESLSREGVRLVNLSPESKLTIERSSVEDFIR
jgi:hypothetical protein